jgi:uncharacterized protein (DUF427 family)
VWDYPRPPRIATDEREVVVQMEGFLLARSVRTLRVLETASPPTFYIPLADIQSACLRAAGGSSRCEWKGQSRYWSVMVNGALLEAVAWSYPEPLPGFEAIRDHLSFYPARLQCTLAGTRVHPQPGSFYGGWVTPDVVGPFKGEPGSASW